MPDSSNNLEFSCNCGKLRGVVDASALQSSIHVACFCADCRAAELYLDQPDPAPDPIRLLQTSPDRIRITQGKEHLALLRLGPKGLFRWYAGCCGTPMFNTLGSPRLPFASVISARFSKPDALGPVVARAHVPVPGGKPRNEGMARMVLALFGRMASALLSGRWKQTPFFDPATGQPVVEPRILTREERRQVTR